MPRKSAASLSVLPPSGPLRQLQAPANLSAAEAALWTEIVSSKPSGWFDGGCEPVLKEYVRAAVSCDRMAERVRAALEGEEPAALRAALEMRDKESRRVASLATKMRLTQQSRYTPHAAAVASRQGGGPRPWTA